MLNTHTVNTIRRGKFYGNRPILFVDHQSKFKRTTFLEDTGQLLMDTFRFRGVKLVLQESSCSETPISWAVSVKLRLMSDTTSLS